MRLLRDASQHLFCVTVHLVTRKKCTMMFKIRSSSVKISFFVFRRILHFDVALCFFPNKIYYIFSNTKNNQAIYLPFWLVAGNSNDVIRFRKFILPGFCSKIRPEFTKKYILVVKWYWQICYQTKKINQCYQSINQ